MRPRSFSITLTLAALVMLGAAQLGFAHFPWLATDKQGHALLYFSESPAERNYHTPESVAKAKVTARLADGKTKQLEVSALEEDAFVGLRSAQPAPAEALLTTTCQYGVYHGTLLNYYAKHASSLKGLAEPVAKGLKLDAVAKPTEDGLVVHVLWEGKPLEGATVTLVDPKRDATMATSNKQGVATLALPSEGLVGLNIGHMVTGVNGELDGAEYGSESHYLTVTWDNAEAPKAAAVPPLPEPVASFGAAVSDGWLYVYSGHIGTAHDHSRDNLSEHFRRVRLDAADPKWEELPMQTPLQGLPLVAHDGKLYRAGGLIARNPSGEEEDLHSTDEVACFDPAAKVWTALPPLPTPRSSHDAVVIGDKLYVVGGWQLTGSSDGTWRDSVCVLDLTSPHKGWRELEGPPVRRRALAAAHAGGKLVVVGGMDEENGVTQRVDCYDPATDDWTRLADFPGDDVHGFGVSAWTRDGRLFASGNEGVVYRLADGGDAWRPAATLNTPRFFHRLLPGPDGALLAVAGASFEHGHLAGVERVALK